MDPVKLFLKTAKSDGLNTLTYMDYFDRLKALALSRFEWIGLPETCNARFLETVLFQNGIACFCEHNMNGALMNLRVIPSTEMNVYEEFTSYTAYSVGYNQIYNSDDIVIVRNNHMEKPTEESIQLFALRLAQVERTIDINLNAQKTPIIIQCDEKERLTFSNLYKQYDGNSPIIYGTKALDTDKFKVMKTDAPFLVDKLTEQKRQIWNEALAFLGINSNPSQDKKERLITDEVNVNNEQLDTMICASLATRQRACEELNKKYGLNVQVKLREMERGEVDNEQVHDGASTHSK